MSRIITTATEWLGHEPTMTPGPARDAEWVRLWNAGKAPGMSCACIGYVYDVTPQRVSARLKRLAL